MSEVFNLQLRETAKQRETSDWLSATSTELCTRWHWNNTYIQTYRYIHMPSDVLVCMHRVYWSGDGLTSHVTQKTGHWKTFFPVNPSGQCWRN